MRLSFLSLLTISLREKLPALVAVAVACGQLCACTYLPCNTPARAQRPSFHHCKQIYGVALACWLARGDVGGFRQTAAYRSRASNIKYLDSFPHAYVTPIRTRYSDAFGAGTRLIKTFTFFSGILDARRAL